MNWSQISDQARAVDLNRVSSATRRALRDKKTRDAVARTIAQGRSTYAQFVGDDAKTGLGKLARDAKTQEDVGALVRSVAQTIDTGRNKRPRKSWLRRFGMLSVIALAVGAVAAKRRRTHGSIDVSEATAEVVEPLNGTVTEAERSLHL